MDNGLLVLIGFLVVFIGYFIPGIIASKRKHQDAGAIWVVNIFLGWTFLGWVAALIWANTRVVANNNGVVINNIST